MYLENSEQSKVSGEGEPSTEAMLAEQCQVPKLTEAADLTSPSKGSADLGMKVLVDYTEQTVVSREIDPSIFCVEHCNLKRDEMKSSTYCNGQSESFAQYPESNGLFESDQILGQCETSGLSQPFDECAQHCECFKPCKSSEHCANHSLASKCSPCCEHSAEHLQLFQQCKPSDQQFESFDFEPDKLAVNCDGFGPCEMSDFIPECTDHLDLLQQYDSSDQQGESFDSEPDTSTEDFEQCEMTGFTSYISDSLDLLDCATELREYDECTNDDDNEEIYAPEHEDEQNDTETIDANPSHFNTPAQVYFDDSGDFPFTSECCETHHHSEEDSPHATALNTSSDYCEMCETDYFETSEEYDQQCATSDQCSDEASEFGTEEDGSSDCSSIETKSFKTCPDGSIPSDHCSDSSGQTQWESFEDDVEIDQNNVNITNEDKNKTPAVDVVIEDYFDLFDRADYYGHAFAQKQRYISCFDGGDIHDHLHLQEVQSKAQAKYADKFKEINEEIHVQKTDTCFDAPKEACEDTHEEDASQRGDVSSGSCESEEQSEDESESSLADNEVERDESEAQALCAENCEETEEDENSFDGEACAFDGHVSEICKEEETEVYLSSGNESMSAPCAEDIFVGGDAYEEESVAHNYESIFDNTSTTGHLQTTEPVDKVFIACSEMEPYWSLVHHEENGEMCELGVEEYYAYQIKSIQSSVEQALNEFIMGRRSYDQIIHGDASRIETEDAPLSLNDIQAHEVCPEEHKAVRFESTEVIELSENLANSSDVEKTTSEETRESDEDSGISDISREKKPPSDIIHSVVSHPAKNKERTEENKPSEQSTDSEEEQSDDEFDEDCECEYCNPPIEEVPAKPLLPRMKSNDAGKICVVIDLDETLVHSSFKPVNNADFIIPVEIDGTVHQVYVLKRPHVDEFLKRMGEMFECVLFTASLSKYADPVSDLLDKWGAFRSRLFRESCVFHKGNYVKDLSRLGRDLNKVIIIDNSPASYIFHPDNAVPVASWFDDMSDTELLDLIPFFERLSKVDDIYDVLQQQRTSS
ncbi:uncharacterized protein LOC117251546 isoform X1 [Epinephelus lanceolatus]|uniref:uncharacterized protein LOC117251546 isoform X1 n=1 Tax=Epinephelus lanceolatus TaxID=310571 RepID=UPI0014469549|nr:uncharacterized protein LOC117251546 isoform X1 [Epinephelus lanceolatus]